MSDDDPDLEDDDPDVEDDGGEQEEDQVPHFGIDQAKFTGLLSKRSPAYS